MIPFPNPLHVHIVSTSHQSQPQPPRAPVAAALLAAKEQSPPGSPARGKTAPVQARGEQEAELLCSRHPRGAEVIAHELWCLPGGVSITRTPLSNTHGSKLGA